MADVETNREVWEREWDWSRRGEEWSDWWGGTPALWFGALFPRLHAFVPTGTILEIAPGYGRWTEYLKDLCERLIAVDLAEQCIEHCRERFAAASNLELHVNDGRSLQMVEDASVDLAFSFDSLVHAEADVLEAYLRQLAKKLKPDGIGFFHHSNMAEHARANELTMRLPERIRRPLVRRGAVVDVYAWRAASVGAERFAGLCREAGLACVAQERITWESGPVLMDALSLFTPRGSRWDRPRKTRRNRRFREEAERMASLYARTSFPRA